MALALALLFCAFFGVVSGVQIFVLRTISTRVTHRSGLFVGRSQAATLRNYLE